MEEGQLGKRDACTDEDTLFTECVWLAVKEGIKHSLVAHNIESYDHFVLHQLPHIIRESGDITQLNGNGTRQHKIRLINVHVQAPNVVENDGTSTPLSPHIARLRNLTYAADVCADVLHTIKDISTGESSEYVYRSSSLARIPVMVRSCICTLTNGFGEEDECLADRGGYFIIGGNEKNIVSQAKLKTNTIFCFASQYAGSARHKTAEIRAVNEAKMRSTSTVYVHINDILSGQLPKVVCELPFLTTTLPVLAVFRLLGDEGTAADISEAYFTNLDFDADVKSIATMTLSLQEDSTPRTYESTLDVVGKTGTKEVSKEKRDRYLQHIISSELFPHVSLNDDEESRKKKRFFLSLVFLKLVAVALKKEKTDDRDDLTARRVDAPGALLALLFRQLFRNGSRYVHILLKKALDDEKRESNLNAGDIISSRKTTAGLRYALNTGNWGVNRSGGNATNGQLGVVQIISRLNSISALASMRRINIPLAREGRAAGPRQLHLSSWGFICCSETPEGAACGLVTNLTLLAKIRVGSPSACLCSAALSCGTVPLFDERGGKSLLFVNGAPEGRVPVGTCLKAIVAKLKALRRKAEISFDVSIATLNKDIYLSSDAGAIIRPLVLRDKVSDFVKIVSENQTTPDLWMLLVRKGCIEYVDALEQTNLRVALWPEHLRGDNECHPYTHVELHPALAVSGLMLSLTPFAHHNPGPRNAYQCAQAKQSIGLFATNFNRRMDVLAHVLIYPQRPLACTRVEDILPTKCTRAGAVPMVAILCLDGFNQEDSMYMSRAAVERGLFRNICYHTLRDECKQSGADSEMFENAKKIDCLGLKEASYDYIQDNGLPRIGTLLKPGMIIIGKTVSCSTIQVDKKKGETRRNVKRCKSMVLKGDEDVIVDAVLRTKNTEGNDTVKIRLRSLRTPAVGDKFCLTPDHEVLTQNGWKGIDMVEVGEHILTYDPVADSMAYEEILSHMSFDTHNTKMYNVSNSSIDLCTTMEHKMYVETGSAKHFELIQAKDVIAKDVRYKKICSNGLNTVDIPLYDGFQKEFLSQTNDPVYCVSVRTGIFYVRRNGKTCFTGNSSRHGQKGVVGKFLEPHELPVCIDTGEVPDIIINPHALPSRMTLGHLIECLAGEAACRTGEIADATLFAAESVELLLEKCGATEGGIERTMRCGKTGKILAGKVFSAPIFYQRLKHMSCDKIHARSRGTRQLVSRQPVEGRSRDGGLRVGEMERDAIASHGASQLMQDRMLDASDAFLAYICCECGGFASPPDEERGREAFCIHCNNTQIRSASIPFSYKLLSQELFSVGVRVSLK